MLHCQKDQFFLPPDLHYLNCAYMSPQSRRVAAAGAEGLTRQQVPTRITVDSFFDEGDQLRDRFARIVGAPDPQRVAILSSVSMGIAAVAKNVQVHKSQNILVLAEQFPSNYYSWSRLSRETGAELRVVAPPSEGHERTALWNEAILNAIDESTAVVAMAHAHWSDGTLFDLAAVGRRAREVGAALIVDGTQTVGALPFSVAEVEPDALICAGYKTLHGPYGLALGYYGHRFDDGVPLEEGPFPREGSEDFTRLVDYNEEYRPGAIRYDVGERSNPILLPMYVAALDQILEWGPESIQRYCRDLVRQALEQLREAGFAVESEKYRCGHLFGIRAPQGLDLEDLRQALAANSVSVSVRGNAIRVAPSVYNDEADMAALVESLLSCLATV